jgi:hypothetical protein
MSKWVPQKLTDAQKLHPNSNVQKNPKILKKRVSDFFFKNLTLDETYCSLFESKTPSESKVWVFEDEDAPTQVKTSDQLKD